MNSSDSTETDQEQACRGKKIQESEEDQVQESLVKVEPLCRQLYHRSIFEEKDIFEKIMTSLSLKSVGNLRCVSKELLSLTSDPEFVLTYCSRVEVSGFFLSNSLIDQPRHFPLEFNGYHQSISSTSSLPDPSLSFLGPGAAFDDSSKGLILGHLFHSRNYRCQVLYVCNPMTKKYTTFCGPNNTWFRYLSLAFDPSLCSQFKVVGITSEVVYDYRSMHVFSSETEMWKPLIQNLQTEFPDIDFYRSVFWNGSLIWMGYEGSLLSLDLEREQFERLPSVQDFVDKYCPIYSLSESRGCLYFVGNLLPRLGTLKFDILEMKPHDSGWSPMYHVDLSIVVDLYPEIKHWSDFLGSMLLYAPVFFMRGGGCGNGDQLLLSIHRKIVSYHIQDKTFTTVCNDVPQAVGSSKDLRKNCSYHWRHLYPHVHCLFSPVKESISTRTSHSHAQRFEYQAEVSLLLDIITDSLYNVGDIFLRQLISNSSDISNKIRSGALINMNNSGKESNIKHEIMIKLDPEKKILSLLDRHIGMTLDDDFAKCSRTLIQHGISSFQEEMEKMQTRYFYTEIVQWLGVGPGIGLLYLLAEHVEVINENNDHKEYFWESNVNESFAISMDTLPEAKRWQTEIRLHLRGVVKESVKEAKLKELADKYSQFVNFPIYLRASKKSKVRQETLKKCRR